MTKRPTTAIDKRLCARLPARSGRPPRENAGEVDERILDAAQRVFLHRGFEGASIDEIAEVARAGKPTIYARHAGKEELFAAVVVRNVPWPGRFEDLPSTGATLAEPSSDGSNHHSGQGSGSRQGGLFRSTIAEARRFPDLAPRVKQMARERGMEAITRLLCEMAEGEELGALRAFSADRLQTAGRIFLDIIVLPMVVGALFGDSLESLRAEIPEHVSSRVSFFLAACRHRSDN